MLKASYMEEFKCIGTECPDSCCQGWRVNIGRKTYKQYKKSKHPELKPIFQKSLARTRNSSCNEYNFAYIKLDHDHNCPFLSEKSLCRIQDNLGEQLLSQTCNTYPREYNLIDGTLEKSATLSCPEAARLALLQKDGIGFVESPDDDYSTGKLAIAGRVETHSQSSIYDVSPYFWDLHLFSIEVMQNRKFKIWQRLLTLGFMSRKVENAAKKDNLNSIPEIISQYRQQMDGAPISLYEDVIPVKHDIQLSLIQVLLKDSIIDNINNARFLECHRLFSQGISKNKSSKNQEILKNYTNANNDYYFPFMEKHQYIIENYLVNYLFKSLFPVSKNSTAQQTYITLVVNYTIIKSYLVGMAGTLKEDLSTDHVIMLIQSFSKVIEHDKTYTREIRTFLRKNNFDQLAHMAVLLRNETKNELPPLPIAV